LNKKNLKTAGWIALLLFVLLYGPLWLIYSDTARDIPEGVTKLTIATWAGSSAEGANVEEEIFKAFMAENPDVYIHNVYTPWVAYKSKLLTMFIGNNAPDLCWVQLVDLPFLASRGIFHDLTDTVKKDPEINIKNYSKVATAICSWQGRLYALPRDLAGWFVAYNKDLFDKAKVPYPKSGWTWEDYTKTAKRLTKDTDNDGQIDQFGSWWTVREDMMLSNGAWFFTEDVSKSSITTPGFIDAVQWTRDLTFKNHAAPQQHEMRSVGNLFMNQKAAMAFGGPWNIASWTKDLNFRWDIVDTPHGSAGGYKSTGGLPIAICATTKRGTKEFDAAYRLLKFLCYSETAQRLQAELGIGVPSRKDLVRKFYEPLAINPPSIHLYLDSMDKWATFPPPCLFQKEAGAIFKASWDLILLDQVDTVEELTKAADKIDKLLKKKSLRERKRSES
jgi:multiple sugar transport system substrate-binding protein